MPIPYPYTLYPPGVSGGGGGGPAGNGTIANLTNASPAYTMLSTDVLVNVDVSGGALAGDIKAPANMAVGQRFEIANVGGDAAAQPFFLNGNGVNVEDPNMPGGVQTFSARVPLKVRGGSWAFRFDGTRLVEVV